MSKNLKAHLAVLAANLFYGVNYSVMQYITHGYISAFGLTLLRALVATSIFWLLIFVYPCKVGIERRHWGRFLLCGLTGVTINQLFFIKGLSLTFSIHAALLGLVTPIFITFIAAYLIKEKITFFKLAGLVLGVSGSLLLILRREVTGSAEHPLAGDIFIIINAVSYAFFLVLVKPLMAAYSPLHVLRWIFTFGLPFIAIVCWPQFTAIEWQRLGYKEYASLASIIVAATIMAYLFNLYSIRQLGSSVTGAYIYTQPVFATLIAVFVLGESLTLYKIVAGLLIASGVVLVNRKIK